MTKKVENNGARTALYRKYRPRSLDEIVSQNHATDILRRSLQQGKIAHAYLLTGPKGVGKTSIARILAHEINQLPYTNDEPHLDIIEIDAASNNGVDDVRELRDRVMIAPASASKKVYIIDEVHMLSKQAFNALLKTLEEPPAHVVFILATTDLHKVPDTIISRTQHFAFHAISRSDLAAHLKKIAIGEGIKITDEALEIIAARGDGSFRNAISLLDQLSGYADNENGITRELVESTLGFAPTDAVETLITAVEEGAVSRIISTLDTLEQEGIQPTILTDQLIESLRSKLPQQPKFAELIDALLNVPNSSWPQLKLLTTLVMAAKPVASHTPVTKAIVAAKRSTKSQPTVIEAPVIVVDKSDTQKEETKKQQTNRDATEEPTSSVQKTTPIDSFDWSALLEYTKENHVALHSMLKSCSWDLNGGILTIYCGRKFNKAKLDETKYRTQLGAALDHIGQGGLAIETIGTTKPPADEKLARIAEIMGGGEEIALDEPEEKKE